MDRPSHGSPLASAVVTALLGAALLSPSPANAGKPGGGATGRFTCRASALRADQLLGSTVEPTVANGPEDPCVTDNAVLLPVGPIGGLDLAVDVLVASTEDTKAPVTSEGFAVGADILGLVTAEVLTATATAKSVNGVCVLSGQSSVTSATVAGVPVNVINGHLDVPIVGVGTVHFNETLSPSSNKLIQRALWLEITNPLVRTLTGVEEVVVAEAVVDFEGGNPCGGRPANIDKRRMTGGGKFANGSGTATHGFVLHCNASRQPNRLQVNWGGNRFHLEGLSSATCRDAPGINPGQPAAGFDTYEGTGSGRLNGVAGATAQWTFTDAGEPGYNDTVRLVIRNASGAVVLNVNGSLLNKGNHQAH